MQPEKRLKGWSGKKKKALFQRDWEEINSLFKNYSSNCKHSELVEGLGWLRFSDKEL